MLARLLSKEINDWVARVLLFVIPKLHPRKVGTGQIARQQQTQENSAPPSAVGIVLVILSGTIAAAFPRYRRLSTFTPNANSTTIAKDHTCRNLAGLRIVEK